MPVVTRTEAGRRSAVREWRRSGLDAATFASVLGVSVHTLYAWSCRFRSGASGRPVSAARVKGCGPGLVELVASGSTAQERGGSAGHGRVRSVGVEVELELRCGRTLRFSADLDEAALRRVIAASESA